VAGRFDWLVTVTQAQQAIGRRPARNRSNPSRKKSRQPNRFRGRADISFGQAQSARSQIGNPRRVVQRELHNERLVLLGGLRPGSVLVADLGKTRRRHTFSAQST